MKMRTFVRLLIALVSVGVLLTLAHLNYAADAYTRAPIIQFIARELW